MKGGPSVPSVTRPTSARTARKTYGEERFTNHELQSDGPLLSVVKRDAQVEPEQSGLVDEVERADQDALVEGEGVRHARHAMLHAHVADPATVNGLEVAPEEVARLEEDRKALHLLPALREREVLRCGPAREVEHAVHVRGILRENLRPVFRLLLRLPRIIRILRDRRLNGSLEELLRGKGGVKGRRSRRSAPKGRSVQG